MSDQSTFNILPGVPLVESPLFARTIEEMGLNERERAVAIQLNRSGYALIDFPDQDIDARIARILARLGPLFGVDFDDPEAIKNEGHMRLQDSWVQDEDVRALAANAELLALLSKLYGRRAFPFQTLNFPVGTQQNAHCDAVHFSSLPERFMCGVWLAFEDVHPDAGPLLYYPGSHRWPIPSNAMLGQSGQAQDRRAAQNPFEPYWQAMVEANQCTSETFLPRKGQALIWSANLLHGGGIQNDLRRTRWSQVTHYYFEDCIYYTPAFSDEALGQLDMRRITNVVTGEIEPNRYQGTVIDAENKPGSSSKKWRNWFSDRRRRREINAQLPADFSAEDYYLLNPDVALHKADAKSHYVHHGRREGRRYKAGSA